MIGTNDEKIAWAPKVRQEQIWRLYQNDAHDLIDEGLIEDVGLDLYSRCQSIIMVTERKRAPCPRCHHVIVCPGERWSREYAIVCPQCLWRATYGQYRDSWRQQDLHGGNAMYAFRAFVEGYELAKSPRERMLLIDKLIHAFHWSLKRKRVFHPAASNLIQGRSEAEVVAFLDRLTYGGDSTPGTRETYAEWRRSWMESEAKQRLEAESDA